MKKVVKRIAVMLVTIIMLLFVLTSCDLMVSDILSFLNIKSKSKQLSELGIGYAYNLIENEAYDVTKISDKCYELDGVQYKSLSAVARAITGTRWNGKLFFGVKK